jgi:MSHA pilin protein MshD
MEPLQLNHCSVSPGHLFRTGAQSRSPRSGFTLVEVVVCTLLVGLVAVASLKSSAAVIRSRQGLSDQRLASALCQRYLAEVLQCYYQDPTEASPNFGTESGESTRNQFDDVDDYKDWSEFPPTTREGSPLPGYGNWTVNIAVDFVDVTNPNSTPVSDQGLKRVTVTVTDPASKQVVLKGLRTKFGADEKAPYVEANHVQWIGFDLRMINAATKLRAGTQPIDQAKIGN